jgi:hypothetical protein
MYSLSARKKQTVLPSFAYPGMPYHTVGRSAGALLLRMESPRISTQRALWTGRSGMPGKRGIADLLARATRGVAKSGSSSAPGSEPRRIFQKPRCSGFDSGAMAPPSNREDIDSAESGQ